MAKKALRIKAAATPKFKVRGYTRCQKSGRDGTRGRTARRLEEQLVGTLIAEGPRGNRGGKAATT